MLDKLYNKIALWVYEKVLTYELFKLFKANKYKEKK